MATITCRVTADGETMFEETFVNDRSAVEAVSKDFHIMGVHIDMTFMFDPPLVKPPATEES